MYYFVRYLSLSYPTQGIMLIPETIGWEEKQNKKTTTKKNPKPPNPNDRYDILVHSSLVRDIPETLKSIQAVAVATAFGCPP